MVDAFRLSTRVKSPSKSNSMSPVSVRFLLLSSHSKRVPRRVERALRWNSGAALGPESVPKKPGGGQSSPVGSLVSWMTFILMKPEGCSRSGPTLTTARTLSRFTGPTGSTRSGRNAGTTAGASAGGDAVVGFGAGVATARLPVGAGRVAGVAGAAGGSAGSPVSCAYSPALSTPLLINSAARRRLASCSLPARAISAASCSLSTFFAFSNSTRRSTSFVAAGGVPAVWALTESKPTGERTNKIAARMTGQLRGFMGLPPSSGVSRRRQSTPQPAPLASAIDPGGRRCQGTLSQQAENPGAELGETQKKREK